MGISPSHSDLSRNFSLYQNYPNPFNPVTTIRFTSTRISKITIKIFNLFGAEVAKLIDQRMPAGEHKVVFDAQGFPSGMYFYRIEADGFVRTKKLLLLK